MPHIRERRSFFLGCALWGFFVSVIASGTSLGSTAFLIAISLIGIALIVKGLQR